MLSQLTTYGPLWWSAFLAIALLAGRFGVVGILVGQVLIAVAVVALDLQWVQAEMARPDWDGAPDQDVIFIFGVAFRVVAINALLLPVGVLGYWSRAATPTRSA